MSPGLDIQRLEARKEAIEARLDDRVIVNAMRVDADGPRYTEMFAPPSEREEQHQHWWIAVPGIAPIVGHEIPVLSYFGDQSGARFVVQGLAELIVKATGL